MPNAKFLPEIDDAYRLRRRNVVVLAGNVNDLHSYDNAFMGVEQVLYQSLVKGGFLVARADMSSGISFFTDEDEAEAAEILKDQTGSDRDTPAISNLQHALELTFQSPGVMLFKLQQMERKISRMVKMGAKYKGEPVRHLCVILRSAEGIFPANTPDRMSESDRLRLISFLGWVNNPLFTGAGKAQNDDEVDLPLPLVILIADSSSEVNNKITELPHCSTITIDLPDTETRDDFIGNRQAQYRLKRKGRKDLVKFEHGEQFVNATAGLTLQAINDLMETAYRTAGTVTKKAVVEEANRFLKKLLGNVVTFVVPEHTVDDIVGYEKTKEVFRRVLKRLDDPKQAVSAVLLPGPNGSGKTFIGEAFAAESGWAVIELSGLRDSGFGETEKRFEKLKMFVRRFGKVMIFVDEAHTAFASAHQQGVHEVEKRLTGEVFKMMGDPTLRGKVVWILMTSRADELDPDIIRRAPIQIAIMDLEDGERKEFIKKMFQRRGVKLADDELEQVYGRTLYYSASDFDNLLREILNRRTEEADISVLDVMQQWHASTGIVGARRYQSLVAAKFCTYPALLPDQYRLLAETGRLEEEITREKRKLYGIAA